jgi:hypothetical protein
MRLCQPSMQSWRGCDSHCACASAGASKQLLVALIAHELRAQIRRGCCKVCLLCIPLLQCGIHGAGVPFDATLRLPCSLLPLRKYHMTAAA